MTGLLMCDECGKIHADDEAALIESCECTRFKQRMDWATAEDVLTTLKKKDDEIERLREALAVFADASNWMARNPEYRSNLLDAWIGDADNPNGFARDVLAGEAAPA